jgi:hypothetical protein
MKTDAQYKLFDEIARKKTLIIRDLHLPAGREKVNEYTGEIEAMEERDEYIKYGEYTIKGYPFENFYFNYLTNLINDFWHEFETNRYYKSIDYKQYREDIDHDLNKLLKTSFLEYNGSIRCDTIQKIIHIDFTALVSEYNFKTVSKEMYPSIYEFSAKFYDVLKKLYMRIHLTSSSTEEISNEQPDTRINCPANIIDIEKYFFKLEGWFTKNEIEQFLHANFQCFEGDSDKKLLKSEELSAADIQYFIFRFIKSFHKEGKRIDYAKLCKDNFIQFKGQDVDVIRSNFRGTKPKKYFLDLKTEV